MRLIKFLFTLSTAAASFAGFLYLYQRYQEGLKSEHFRLFESPLDNADSADDISSTQYSDLRTPFDLNGIYYKSMDPEEITESD